MYWRRDQSCAHDVPWLRRTVDKLRLAKRLGAVSAKTLGTTLSTLQEVFAA